MVIDIVIQEPNDIVIQESNDVPVSTKRLNYNWTHIYVYILYSQPIPSKYLCVPSQIKANTDK